MYRGPGIGMHVLLSNSRQSQAKMSRNLVQAFSGGSVVDMVLDILEWLKILYFHEFQKLLKNTFVIRSLLVTVGLSLTSNNKYLTNHRFSSEILAYRKMNLHKIMLRN